MKIKKQSPMKDNRPDDENLRVGPCPRGNFEKSFREFLRICIRDIISKSLKEDIKRLAEENHQLKKAWRGATDYDAHKLHTKILENKFKLFDLQKMYLWTIHSMDFFCKRGFESFYDWFFYLPTKNLDEYLSRKTEVKIYGDDKSAIPLWNNLLITLMKKYQSYCGEKKIMYTLYDIQRLIFNVR